MLDFGFSKGQQFQQKLNPFEFCKQPLGFVL